MYWASRPIVLSSQARWVTFNGEIYGFAAKRSPSRMVSTALSRVLKRASPQRRETNRLPVRYGARVRKPAFPEQLYIDFDGFFAACEEQADRRLQGRPLGVIPFAGAVHSCVIAANTMAKRAGVILRPRVFLDT